MELLVMIVTLSNGKRVANFSSPHSFTFEDGSILPAHSEELSEKLKINFVETHLRDGDILLHFTLTKDVENAMFKYQELYNEGIVDIVFCPLPMITAIKDNSAYGLDYLLDSPFRSIRQEDRIKKLVSIHKQCL
jgi:hypothetical protein